MGALMPTAMWIPKNENKSPKVLPKKQNASMRLYTDCMLSTAIHFGPSAACLSTEQKNEQF